MLSLPSKPWKKARIEAVAEYSYRFVFLTEFPDEAAFRQAIDTDVRRSLGARDEVGEPDWATRSVAFTTRDLITFKRNLVFACVMIELE